MHLVSSSKVIFMELAIVSQEKQVQNKKINCSKKKNI